MSVEMKTLTCEVCGSDFQHPKQRGRPPRACLEHRGQVIPKKKQQSPEVQPQAPAEADHKPKDTLRSADKPPNTFFMVCGACGAAPRDKYHEAAHLRCSDRVTDTVHCGCAMVGHHPNAQVRRYQSKYNYLTVEECAKLDPGLSR